VNRQVWLRVGGEPKVREVEMVEVRWRGRRRALQVEDRCLALGGDEAARQARGSDQEDDEKEDETVATAPPASARPWVTAYWNVGCDAGNPLD
jgi:hypothetical protein